MAIVPPPEFKKLRSNQIESLRLEYKEVMKHHPDADAVMERVHGILIDISRLAGRTPASLGESPKLTLIVQNMA
jgi:hypothetical protein